jgi:hypothetical protein
MYVEFKITMEMELETLDSPSKQKLRTLFKRNHVFSIPKSLLKCEEKISRSGNYINLSFS